MWTEPSIVQRMRAEIQAVLPPKAFLRRDRGEGLFITNAPVFAPDLNEIPGFIVEQDGKMMRILPDEGWIAHLEEDYSEAPDFFCASLARFRALAPDRENLMLFAAGAKILDAFSSASEDEIIAYDRALRQRTAVALRGGCGGGLYGCALLNSKIYSLYKGE